MEHCFKEREETALRYVSSFDLNEDAFLMRRFQSGEASAFNELFARYRRFVFNIVYRVLDDAMLSEDLTQLVFFKLWKAPLAFREGSLAAWLTRVSRNCALDELRRRKLFAPFPNIATDQQTPFERVAADLDACRLHAAIRRLAAAQRAVIELNFFAGLTHVQISERTRVPLGTVKTRIRAGLQSLRTVLEDHDTVQATVIPISRLSARGTQNELKINRMLRPRLARNFRRSTPAHTNVSAFKAFRTSHNAP